TNPADLVGRDSRPGRHSPSGSVRIAQKVHHPDRRVGNGGCSLGPITVLVSRRFVLVLSVDFSGGGFVPLVEHSGSDDLPAALSLREVSANLTRLFPVSWIPIRK
ncbi:hypothetical protein TorRG33x02_011370, partial [Trema orientale]